MSNLRVWWCPQLGAKIPDFIVEVSSVREGALLMDTLANYDLFQLDNNIKPDYSNTGGLQILESDGWVDWYDSHSGIDDPCEFLEAIDRKEIPASEDEKRIEESES